ncbi:DUF2304 family protein [Methanobacterium alkalithermotolerans]|uniref:DUF2304 family protein n=1 Tax=Methanobacterium alkalithermotolerans TaxID=2731220 RepID=A0A8T8K978_9EURY|nr:DUF2304 family protein [Methanobacterium alkalithermotolerans]QUH24135.1 DUF2304 family protein [Methanobacterium alkalithermotolerans]
MIYPYIAGLIALIGIILSIIRFREGRTSPRMLLFWIIIWIMVILISFFPQETTIFANIFGIGRGLDFIIILGLIGCYYLIFKIYTMIERLESDISQLVREIAIKNEKIESIIEKIEISSSKKE